MQDDPIEAPDEAAAAEDEAAGEATTRGGASAAGGGSPASRSPRWSSWSSRRSRRPTRTASTASPRTTGSSAAAQDAAYSVIPNYTVPGLDGSLSKIVAGLIGIAVVFAVMWLLGRVLARRRT